VYKTEWNREKSLRRPKCPLKEVKRLMMMMMNVTANYEVVFMRESDSCYQLCGSLP
jgi:hypothetical protein